MPKPPVAGPYQISTLVRTATITAMRQAFSIDPTFTYKALKDGRTDFDNTLIEITDAEPITEIRVPTIVIRSLADSVGSSIYFDDDLVRQVKDKDGHFVGEIHGGRLNLNVNMEVWAWDSLEREQVTDAIYIYLKTLKDVIAGFGIEVRKIHLNSPSEEPVGDRVLFKSGINFDSYSEWDLYAEYSPKELITKFAVTVKDFLISDNLNTK